MIQYHDKEWGVPVHDDRTLFEFLVLESAQAGLTWQTVLNKRENYRNAFDAFDPAKIALYNSKDVRRILRDSGIIRNRLKIDATITNARRFLTVREEFGSFNEYVCHAGRWNGERPHYEMLQIRRRLAGSFLMAFASSSAK